MFINHVGWSVVVVFVLFKFVLLVGFSIASPLDPVRHLKGKCFFKNLYYSDSTEKIIQASYVTINNNNVDNSEINEIHEINAVLEYVQHKTRKS